MKTKRISPGKLSTILNELKADNLCRCCRCKDIKELIEFNNHQQNKKYPYCKLCERKSHRQSERKIHIYNKFNITKEQFEEFFKIQKNKCSICKNHETHVNARTKEVQSLTIDHCHNTGIIRGLICRNCNLMIGNAKDSVKTLRAAIRYLNRSIDPSPLPALLLEGQNNLNKHLPIN